MIQEKYTLAEYAELMRSTRPYLQALEELVSDVEYGSVELTLDVRAGVVEKMTVISKKYWLKPKVGHPQNGFAPLDVEH